VLVDGPVRLVIVLLGWVLVDVLRVHATFNLIHNRFRLSFCSHKHLFLFSFWMLLWHSIGDVAIQDRSRLLELPGARQDVLSLNSAGGCGYRTHLWLIGLICPIIVNAGPCLVLTTLNNCIRHFLVAQDVKRAHGKFSWLNLFDHFILGGLVPCGGLLILLKSCLGCDTCNSTWVAGRVSLGLAISQKHTIWK